MVGFLIFIGAVIVLIIQWIISKEFAKAAADKGYTESKYFWYCFFFSIAGYLLVIALPNKEIAKGNKQTTNGNDANSENKKALTNIKNFDCVHFGRYVQANDTYSDEKDIEWLVLEKKDNKSLIISKYALDCQPCNERNENVTWETCTLRKWLNNEFINKAFTAEEQARIATVNVPAHKNPEYDTEPGNATNDKVFLLSVVEADKYFSSDSERQCKATYYAEANGAFVASNGYTYWLLRSPGDNSNYCCGVDDDGCVDIDYDVDYSDYGVRPALWINLP